MDDEINQEIMKLLDGGYRSAKFRLALIKEGEFWKILVSRVILDISEPEESKTLFQEENFALEDISVSIDEFKKFIDYLGTVHIGDISREGKAVIKKELQFPIGNYNICFVGNFPGRESSFQSRQYATMHHGLDKPFFLVNYYIHQSVSVRSRLRLDLTGAELPFESVAELINHFWGSRFEESSMDHSCNMYFPTFEASIVDFKLKGNNLNLKFDFDSNLTNIGNLSVGIIAKHESDTYRKTHALENTSLDVDLGFTPTSVTVYLSNKGKRVDDYNYYNYKPIRVARTSRRQSRADLIAGVSDEDYENDSGLFQEELISKLPEQMQSLIIEAENAFKEDLYRATLVLFRSVIEEGVTLLLKQIGKEKELYNDKFEIGLEKKIKLLTQYIPSFEQVRNELNHVKWFGDKATHEALMPFNEHDIAIKLEPELRLIFTKMAEEIS